MLKLRGVSASYGSVPAISDVSIEIGEGEAVGLLGANGAGKSTTLRVISSLVKLKAGTLTFDGIDQQYVAALDKHSGKTVWRTDRSTDFHDLGPDGKPKLDGDIRKAYGTPGTINVAGRTQLISVGSRAAFTPGNGRRGQNIAYSDPAIISR